ncbi:hypothetical protein FRC11_005480, partial [Ceratobasidium sp. 423]
MFFTESRDKKGSICVFNTQSGQLVFGPLELEGDRNRLSFTYFSPDETRIITGDDHSKTLCVYDAYGAQLGPVVARPNQCAGTVCSVGYSPDGMHIVSDINTTSIAVWDVQTGQMVLGPFIGHSRRITSIKYSHDGTHILSCSNDDTIRTWDAQNGHSQLALGPVGKGFLGGVMASYSPDDAFIVYTSRGHAICVLDIHRKQRALGPLYANNVIQDLTYSPNGAIIMASTAPVICAWDAHTGQCTLKISRLPDEIYDNYRSVPVRFSPDSTRIVSGSFLGTGAISIWDTKSGQQLLGPLERHPNSYGIGLLEYSPDGAHIMSTSLDEDVVYIWDAYTGGLVLGPLNGPNYPALVSQAAYSPDGTRIVTVSDSG